MSTTVESAFQIRPFHIDVPQDELDDLCRRIEATRFADGSRQVLIRRRWKCLQTSVRSERGTRASARPRTCPSRAGCRHDDLAQLIAANPCWLARPGRACPVLDLHMHQLVAHASFRARMG